MQQCWRNTVIHLSTIFSGARKIGQIQATMMLVGAEKSVLQVGYNCFRFSLYVSELLNKSILVRSLDDHLHMIVRTTTGKTLHFGDENFENGKFGVRYNISFDSIVVDTWTSYFDNCIAVDFLLCDSLEKEEISYIWIEPNSNSFFARKSLEIIPLDRSLFTDRNLKDTKLYYSGYNIELEKGVPFGSSDDYVLELQQNIFVRDDLSKNCVDYPTKRYESYNDCDKDFVLTTLAEHYGQDFLPIWATFHLENVTRSHYIDWSFDYYYIFDGTIKSNCSLPCTTTSVKARFLSRKQVFSDCPSLAVICNTGMKRLYGKNSP